MRIILAGGGTMGSVSPLLAIYEELKKKKPEAEFLWIGTKTGPEYKLIKNYKIGFKSIMTAKFRRYFTPKNLADLFILPLAVLQSYFILRKYRPNLIMSAGGFVAVPLVWAGWALKISSIIHQQDVRPGLANKLMARFSKIITVTFEKSAEAFDKEKVILTGNPVRSDILAGDKIKAIDHFHLKNDLPTVLVLGGGTGAYKLNELIVDSLGGLVEFCQIIHSTGGKMNTRIRHSNYHDYDFINQDMKYAYAVADLVITRAGLSTLTELAALKKPTIIIPLPASHQVDNAVEFGKNNAAVVLDQNNLKPDDLIAAIKELLENKPHLENLSRNIGKIMPLNATEIIADIILKK